MIPRWYGARLVRHCPGSALLSVLSLRSRSAHSLTVSRGGEANRAAPWRISSARIVATKLVKRFVDARLERRLTLCRRSPCDGRREPRGDREQPRTDCRNEIGDSTSHILHRQQLPAQPPHLDRLPPPLYPGKAGALLREIQPSAGCPPCRRLSQVPDVKRPALVEIPPPAAQLLEANTSRDLPKALPAVDVQVLHKLACSDNCSAGANLPGAAHNRFHTMRLYASCRVNPFGPPWR